MCAATLFASGGMKHASIPCDRLCNRRGAVFFPASALAWGDVGHKVVCEIAHLELKPEIKARVDALTAADPRFHSFAESCTWPDIFPWQRPPEHYVNLPRTSPGLDPAKPCPEADRCVVSAILADARDLAFASDVMEQARLLKSLGHWVGDVHQPLHVSLADDKGANLIAVTGACSPNLHAV